MVFGSFISFPIFTRLLVKEDYGLMNLINITLMVSITIGSMELPHSVFRFHEVYKEGHNKKRFMGTIRSLSTISGFLMVVLCLLLSTLCFYLKVIDKTVLHFLYLASPLIVIRNLSRLEMSLMRIQEKVKQVNFVNLSIRYGSVAGSVCMVLMIGNLYGYYIGILIAEAAVLLTIIFLYKDARNFQIPDRVILKECITYSFPLIFTALSAYLIQSGDRYIIAYFLGPGAVADYSVAYNYCQYPADILKNAFHYSFVPIIMSAWNKEGLEKGASLLTKYIMIYFWIAIPIVIGLVIIRIEGILLIAGNKYLSAGYLVPVVATGLALNGMNFVFFSGLYYKKKTQIILKISIFSAVLNVVLNIFLIPVFGLIGAAVATLISYAMSYIIALAFTLREIKFGIPYRDIILALISGAFMYLVVDRVMNIKTLNQVIGIQDYQLIAKIVIGVLSYTLIFSLFARKKITALLSEFLKKK